jgi:hypothetical protein
MADFATNEVEPLGAFVYKWFKRFVGAKNYIQGV